MMKAVASACSPSEPAEEKPLVLALGSAHDAKPLTMGKMMAEFDSCFSKWDKDHDGKVSLEELNKALEDLKIVVTKEDMDKIDEDHDGGLNMVEFREAFYTMALKHGDMDRNQILIKTFEVLKGGKDKDAMKLRQETAAERGDRFTKAAKLKAELREMYTAIDKDGDVDKKDLKKILAKCNEKWNGKQLAALLEGLKDDPEEKVEWDDFEATCYTVAMKAPDAKLEQIVSYALNHIYNLQKEKDDEKKDD